MTATITWDGLRELAGFRADKGCAISLYLDLDPSVTPTAGDVATRVSSLLAEVERLAEQQERGAALGVRADIERIEEYFAEEFDRDGAHGIAVFADGPDEIWNVVQLTSSAGDAVRVSDEFLLAPLMPQVGGGDHALVTVVNREAGAIYRVRGGRLVEIADHTEEAPRRHDQGGWSQARFQRSVDNVAQEHYRTVADELETRYRRLGRPPVVVCCPEEIRGEVEQALASEVADAVVGWTNVEQHSTPTEVYEAVAPLLEGWRGAQESETVERWLEEAGRGTRAASGWAETLEAASDARVDVLLYQEGVSHQAFRCPSCGRAAAAAGSCPLDGRELQPVEDGLDVAVRLTLANGGSIRPVQVRPDLDPVGGIGALLRF